MGKTLESIIAWADETIPNKVSSTAKITLLSDLLGDGSFRNFNTYENEYTFYVSSHTAEYDLPSGIRVSDLTYVGITATTYNTTNVLASTTPFTEYKFQGLHDEGTGYREYTTKLAITPKPMGKYHAKLRYRPYYGPYTASSDTTTIVKADNSLINFLQYKLAARICQSMAFPRIDLANNFEMSAEYELSNAKCDYFKRQRALAKKPMSYKRWW